MRLFVFSVRDVVGGFGTPIFLPSPGQAMRTFGDEVNRVEKGNVLNAHPSDFELYQLGYFDTEDGTFLNEKKLLCRGGDLIVRE